MLIVEKLPWANTLDVTRGVEAAIDEMRPGLPGINIDTTIFRPATFIEMSIENLTRSLLIGGFLVVIVLVLFLWEWRVALISATIIPLSLMASMLVLNLRGVTINVMTLAGLSLAIGAVVDDAIVDVENIVRRLRQLRKEGSTQSTELIVLEASIEVRGAIIYASLIEISALLPVFFLQGLSGAFFQPLAGAYVVAGLVSPLIALTVTPALVYILLERAPIGTASPRSSMAAPCLRWGAPADCPQAAPGLRHRRRHHAGRHRGVALPRRRVAALLQGTRLPDALDHQARHVPPRDVAHHRPGLP
jgi:multidrug efflux pump subunit AcrB